MNDRGVIAGVSVRHEYATVDEIADAGADSQRDEIRRLLAEPAVTEAFALHTCNRTEAYVVAPSASQARAALDGFAPGARDAAIVRSDHEESLRHLLRVAAGLDSLVLGEDQILGQMRTAYEDALDLGGLGVLLDDAVTKAIHVGERARTETAINEGHVSIGSAAIAAAAERRPLDGRAALVVGAGEMGTVAADHLADRGARLTVANRTVPHAEHVAETVDAPAEAVGLDVLPSVVADAAIVFSATDSDDPVVDEDVPRSATADTLFVDIAKPRDVAPAVAERPAVRLLDLDAITDVTDETEERRAAAAEGVEEMVDQELDQLLRSFKRQRADEAIAGMHRGAERLKQYEIATALDRLEATGDLTDEQREVVESLGDALVSKLLAAPTASLRDAAEADDWETIRTALDLFDPGSAMPDQAAGAAGPADDVPVGTDAVDAPTGTDATGEAAATESSRSTE